MTSSASTSKSLTKNQLLEGRGDLSPFLVHLTRTGKVKLWADIYEGIKSDDYRSIDAKTCLQRIIETSTIKAVSPFGYFQYKVPIVRRGYLPKNAQSKVKRSWLRSVCFTETPIDHVHFQMEKIEGRSLAFQPYGLAFHESFIRKQGGHPVFYFDSGDSQLMAPLDFMAISVDFERLQPLLPLYQSFCQRFDGKQGDVDFRWEREWRVARDVTFTSSDVAFGICDARDIEFFEHIVEQKFPFVDPRDEMNPIKNKLRLRVPGIK
jgi:hypothetical protein